MTIAAKRGTNLGDLLQYGDYDVTDPAGAWGGAGTRVHLRVEDRSGVLYQYGSDAGSTPAYERQHLHGLWSAWTGLGASASVNFAPTITALDPTTVEDDGEVQAVTVDGTGFVSGCTVEINNDAALAAVTFVSPLELTLSVDLDDAALVAPDTVSVVVVNPDGRRSNVALLPLTEPA